MAGFFIYRLYYVLPNPLNRITAATDNTRRFGLSNLKYDKNGNITHLTRGGHLKEMPDWDKDDDFGTMDQLDYQYFDGSNRLRSVTDGILKNDTSGKGEFVDGNKDGDDYVYDPNGNMTQDLNKGIKGATLAEKGIEYNHLNLPTKVSIDDGGANKGTISYIYDATGVKLRKNVLKQGETTPTAADYAGNFIYENGNLVQFSHPEGYVEVDPQGGYDYVYSYLDHLGTVRLTYSDFNGNGSIEPATEILQERNTYPFGLEHKGYNNIQNGTESNYQTYLGQEMNKELGLNWLTFRYRNYMPELGRFFGVDPVSTEYMSISTYQFAHNSPVWKIELEGLEGKGTSKDDDLTAESVKVLPTNVTVDKEGSMENVTVLASSVALAGGKKPNRITTLAAVGVLATGFAAIELLDNAAKAFNAGAEMINSMAEELSGEEASSSSEEASSSTSEEGTMTPKERFRDAEPASPALKDNPYSPGEVSKRQSKTRREKGLEADPDTPIPDQAPGRNIKDGVHTSQGKTRHSTGERNVSSKEEHSRKPKGNRGVKQ